MGSFSETYNDPLQITLSFVSYKEITCKGKKKRRFLSNKCLSSIISNIINNKNEPGKTVRLTNFSNSQLQYVLTFFQFVDP